MKLPSTKVEKQVNQLLYFAIEEFWTVVHMFRRSYGHKLWMSRGFSNLSKTGGMIQ